jgi:hypothetical protein
LYLRFANSNFIGLPRGEASTSSDEKRGGAIAECESKFDVRASKKAKDQDLTTKFERSEGALLY